MFFYGLERQANIFVSFFWAMELGTGQFTAVWRPEEATEV
jgi:hypothetical protein